MSKEEEPNKEEGCLTLKRTVINRFEYKRLVLRELDGIENCHSAPILESFPLIGITSMIASQYIIDKLNLPLVGVVTTDSGMPTSVVMKSQPGPSIRIYGDSRLVACISESKLTDECSNSVVQMLLDFAERHNAPMIYCAEGIPTQETVIERSKLSFLTTSAEIAEKLKERGHEFLCEAVISGVTGGIVAESPMIKSDTTCLLCPSSAFFPDASSSLELVRTIIFLIPALEGVIDTAELENKATFLEEKVKKLVKLSSSGGGPPPGMFG